MIGDENNIKKISKKFYQFFVALMKKYICIISRIFSHQFADIVQKFSL